MELIICKDANEVGSTAGEIMVDTVKNNPTAILGLATGSTPIKTYEYMIEDHKNNGTSYKEIKTVNLDEYIGLKPTDPQSYRYFMNTTLFDKLDIDKNNTYVPNGIGNPQENAKAYDETLASIGSVDVQILGIGTNGHIAFNEPGTDFSLTTHEVDLVPDTIAANARFFDSMDEVPKTALTMGIASILKAKKIILLAYGENKAAAIKGMFEGDITPDLPASALRNHPNVTVIVDAEAASLLTK